MTPLPSFIPVIPAGGSGTRLWPVSRAGHPKFLFDLTGEGRSLLQGTLERVKPLAAAESIIVTGTAHAPSVHSQVGGRARVLGEPSAKNSMPALAWAAAVALRQDPNATIGSFAADHLIDPPDAFHEAVRVAHAAAASGYLVTIGVRPTSPSIAYGYIRKAPDAKKGAPAGGAHLAAEFVEKPTPERARAFVESGDYAWNAGIFVCRASVLLDTLDELHPAISQIARSLAELPHDASPEEIDTLWRRMPAIAIDYALAEPLAARGRVAVVDADFSWTDIGDFASLEAVLRTSSPSRMDGAGVPVTLVDAQKESLERGEERSGGASVLAAHSRAAVYSNSQRPIVLVGVEGLSIIERDDVLAIISTDHPRELGDAVKALHATEWRTLT